MGDSTDPKKLLLPYLQRADELQKHEPLVAYYCRLYAMERGLKIPPKERGKVVNGLLVSIMNQLEKDKKAVKLSPDDNMYLEGFASRVFDKADKQDRAGRADLNTAKTFYAASIFFEVLHQFGEMPPDIEQRQKYAVWKAADIRKAVSEGRKPVPGPPGGDEDLLEAEGMTWDTEASPQKVVPSSEVSSTAPEVPQPDEKLPSPGLGSQLPRSDSLPRINSIDSLPRPPTTTPGAQGFHHTRQGSADDIDLPSAPTQPVYPGIHHSPPPQYQTGFPGPHPSGHYSSTDSGQETGVPPPAIHDWSGGNSHQTERHGVPPFSGPFSYPTSSPDEYSSNAHNHNYTSFPPPSTGLSPFVNPTDQGFSYTQHPVGSPPRYQPGNTYPSVPPSQNYSTGYVDPPQHQRTTSAPAMPQAMTGISNGMYPSDSGYQPPPEKIAEAHKAARFAVSSLAFDDVPTALEFLRKSLELLTIPSRAI